jgi:hypothetical protein
LPFPANTRYLQKGGNQFSTGKTAGRIFLPKPAIRTQLIDYQLITPLPVFPPPEETGSKTAICFRLIILLPILCEPCVSEYTEIRCEPCGKIFNNISG